MRIVVTGGLGFVGQNLARHLRSTLPIAELAGVDWLGAPTAPQRVIYDRFLLGDFASPRSLALCEGADVVVHLAAQVSVQESISAPHATFANNVMRSEALLEHLRCHSPQTHVIFASSSAICDGRPGAVDETSVARPLSPYGASKLAVEGLLSAFAASGGMRTVTLRFANVYGPHSERQGGLIPTFCRMLLAENRLRINGDGRQTRDYIHVEDICAAIGRAITLGAQGVYQLGTGVASSVLDVAGHFCALDLPRPPDICHCAALPGELRDNHANIDRARRDLGFEPVHDLAGGIAQTYAWYGAQQRRQVA